MRGRHLFLAIGALTGAGAFGCRFIMGADPLTFVPDDGGAQSGDAAGSEAGVLAASGLAISSGALTTAACAIHHGTLECWGSNANGALGFDAGGAVATPTRVPGPDDGGTFAVTAVGLEDLHACALHKGQPYCWGDRLWGRLGQSGGPLDVPVSFSRPVAAVEGLAVGGSFTCVRTPAAEIFCWGDHAAFYAYDQLTSDFDKTHDTTTFTGSYSEVAIPIDSLAGAKSVALGRDHGCVVRAGGDVACWGRNDFRQTGRATSDGCVPSQIDAGPYACVKTPAVVSGLSGVVQLALAETHSCALDAGGKVWCWGANDHGQLGDASAGQAACIETGGQGPPARCTETPVAAFDGADRIAVGGQTSCALKAGNVYCWGDDSTGLLGGSGGDSAVPTQVRAATGEPLANVRDLAVGGALACAITNDDALLCWGEDLATGAILSGARPVAW